MNNTMHVIAPPERRQAWVRWAIRSIPLLVMVVVFGWIVMIFNRPPAMQARFSVSQRDREFNPGQLTIQRGDRVRIVNDDGDLTHHAYIASDLFKFDSGDQAPGRDVNITFSVPGTFNVLCGIHPKMRLTVTVKP